ncbi:MAG: NUMOD3 domain-containing DNA-binding protein [Nanoarchaeota archaeon]
MPFQKGHGNLRTKESYIKQGQRMRGRIVSEETRKKLSIRLKGRKFSEEFKRRDSLAIKKLWKNKEYRQKMVDAHKGQIGWFKGKKRPEISGESHPNWMGDEVGYTGLHIWVRKNLGKPDKCEHCGSNGLNKQKIHLSN